MAPLGSLFSRFSARTLWRAVLRRSDVIASSAALKGIGLFLLVAIPIDRAEALPSFSIQTAQPCSACHVGSFGPALRQQGRDFKLFGYVANDTQKHSLPFSILADGSFTRTQSDQPGGAAPGYSANNNFALDAVALLYGGKISKSVGAFAELEYDAIGKALTVKEIDIRHVNELSLFGSDLVFGQTFNNSPTTQDLWQTSPSWGYPFQSSGLAAGPSASPLLEGSLAGNVVGLGAYTMWNHLLYAEIAGYRGLGRNFLRSLGQTQINGGDSLNGFATYWRLALQQEFEEGAHYVQVGTYGLLGSLYPARDRSTGMDDRYRDIGIDATYQQVENIESTRSQLLSLHGAYVEETADLNASRVLLGTNARDTFSSLKVELSYSFDATFTPTVQYFATHGTADPVKWGTPSGSPNSAGWIAELAYVPWGKPDSPYEWLNVRLVAQYTAYTKFDGSTASASDKNTLFLGFTLALALNR